jgi:hypothetical protein
MYMTPERQPPVTIEYSILKCHAQRYHQIEYAALSSKFQTTSSMFVRASRGKIDIYPLSICLANELIITQLERSLKKNLKVLPWIWNF